MSYVRRTVLNTVAGGLALVLSTIGYAETRITDVSRNGNDVDLEWSTTSDRTIVETTPSLTDYPFQFYGDVLSTNRTTVSNTNTTRFYRLREVDVVNFPDPNLELAVRDEIPDKYAPTNEIYDIDLTFVTRIVDYGGSGISDLNGIGAMENLNTLILYYNQITNITPLANLSSLRVMYLGGNQITDITHLAGLTNLGYLDLRQNDISDISSLAGLTQLRNLTIGGNQITDITPLADLDQLSNLWISGNQILDISILSTFTNLTVFLAEDNQITNISPIATSTRLSQLWLDRNQISDISALSGMTNLYDLSLQYDILPK